MSLYDAAASGDRRKALEAMRDNIAHRIDEGVSGRDLAPLMQRLESITAELDNMADPAERSAADDLAALRAARRGAPDTSAVRRTTG